MFIILENNLYLFCQAIDRFRETDNGVLVATDVAARGLDIPGVRTVVHFQLPHSADVSCGSGLCGQHAIFLYFIFFISGLYP